MKKFDNQLKIKNYLKEKCISSKIALKKIQTIESKRKTTITTKMCSSSKIEGILPMIL
ncbi:hypothetical protein SAMN03080594_103469 [Arenibacter palladensis]|uniref:Uncharacterized protein n=1 Tax=Arenibacter palladensis TaxID=237373 RepID=A0A1M5B0F0_9FLAO|nr:hypothetical protein SAMN03080594_103469 [Arenibacter palladensis]